MMMMMMSQMLNKENSKNPFLSDTLCIYFIYVGTQSDNLEGHHNLKGTLYSH